MRGQSTDLGCQVVWCATERPRSIGTILGEAKVGNFDVPVKIEEDVLGLEVTVNYVEVVQVVEGKRNFRGVELCDWVGESLGRDLS